MRRGVLTLFLATSTLASAADFQGRVRLWLGPAFDSNAKREFVSAKNATAPDGLLFGLLQLDGQLLLAERVRIVGGYDLGARKFLTQPSEDTLVQSAQLEATVTFAQYFAIGLAGRARDRRGADRAYTDLQGGAVLDFFPTQNIDVRATLNAHRFLFYERFGYSFWGPDGGLTARYRFDRHHSISLFGTFNPRTYNANALRKPDPDDPNADLDTRVTRQDAVFGGGLSYSYRGPFHFTFAYAYFDQTSNSFGETVKRHRLSATGGFKLPWQLTVLASLTWQPSIFPDGVYLNPELTLVEDDENVSSLTLKLVKPITKWLDLDLRYAGNLGVYPQSNFLYLRHMVSVGATFTY